MSRLSAEERFLRARRGEVSRWTPPEAHETALAASPEVVAALEFLPAVARVQVYARDSRLYDNRRNESGTWEQEPRATVVLRREQTRQLKPAEAIGWLASYGVVFDAAHTRRDYLGPRTVPAYRLLQDDAAHTRRDYLGPRTVPAYRLLQDDAARMIEIAASDPTTDVQALEDKQARRHIALKAAVPEPPGIVGRIGQTLRRSLPPYRPAPSRDAPGHEPPSNRR